MHPLQIAQHQALRSAERAMGLRQAYRSGTFAEALARDRADARRKLQEFLDDEREQSAVDDNPDVENTNGGNPTEQ